MRMIGSGGPHFWAPLVIREGCWEGPHKELGYRISHFALKFPNFVTIATRVGLDSGVNFNNSVELIYLENHRSEGKGRWMSRIRVWPIWLRALIL